MSKIKPNNIHGVFKVFRQRAEGRPQYVVLLKDRSFLCSCLMLQNAGIVCRHAFLLMRQNPMFRYHISMIPRRWFREMYQGLTDKDLRDQKFLASEFLASGTEKPPENFMRSIQALLRPSSHLPVITQEDATKSWRFSELSGHMKSIADMASNSKEEYHFAVGALKTIERQVRAKLPGGEPVEDLEDVSKKGRFRTKRIRSACEESRKRKKVD
jgi:hypothetical protein